MRPVGASRAAVMAIALGLVVASCAADPSSTQPPTVAGSGGDGEQGAGTPATGTPATDASEAGGPEASASEGAPPAASADRTVTWLDTEFVLPAPWELRFVDGGDVLLRHPTAAGAGGAVTVSLDAADGRPSAASMAADPIETASGAAVPTVELPSVFATGGPGLRITWPDDGSTLIVSDTGITIGISRDGGTVPEAAVAAVLALLATIEPPTVTPAAEPDRQVVAAAPPSSQSSAPASTASDTVVYGPQGLIPNIRLGMAGWDASAYPDWPLLAAPDGFVLLEAQDWFQLAYDARQWMYVGPPGVDPLALCVQAQGWVLASGGEIALGASCEEEWLPSGDAVTPAYGVLGFLPDGTSVVIKVRDGSGICPQLTDSDCPVWTFGMNPSPPKPAG